MVRYTSVLFSQKDAMKIFGVDEFDPGNYEKTFPYPYRGSICCKGKYGDGNPCPFCIPFACWSKHIHFMVNSGNSEYSKLSLTHNHSTSGMEQDGYQYITSHHELTKDEVSLIHSFTITSTGMSAVLEALAIEYPKRNYCTNLINQVMEQKRDLVYSEDRHQMKDIVKKGSAVASRGGLWVPVICSDTTRFSGSHYQMPRLRMYAIIYRSYFTTVDGTHNTNMYRFTNAPWVTKCCLVLYHVIGMGIFISDHFADII